MSDPGDKTEPPDRQPATDALGVASTLKRADTGPSFEPATADRYEIRAELGRGGQSVVSRAWDRQLEREVAIKELNATESDSVRERFLREARITAQLEHPNVVPVYEIGRRKDGTLYTVQKLVRADPRDGTTRTLRKALTEARSLDERLRLLPHFLDLCHGIAYAHAQRVLHRDIKPENVVLGQFGETVILDWGLARLQGDAARPVLGDSAIPFATVGGVAYGTPAYMSPEQARGETATLDPRTDVWSLGALLFELLTGRQPFTGKTALDVVEQVRTATVPMVRELAPQAPAELAAVAQRALERELPKRYASAQAIADEIEAWQSGRRVSVYDYSLFELVRLFVTRHRAVALVALSAFVAVSSLAAVAWSKYVHAREAVSQALVERAIRADRELRWSEAALLYAAAREQDDNPQTQWGWRISGSRGIGAPRRLEGHPFGVKAVAYSPEGKRVATASVDGKVRLFDAETTRLVGTLQAHEGEVTSVEWSADGTKLATAGEDGTAWLWDLARMERLEQLTGQKHPVNRVALSRDGTTAVLAMEEGLVEVHTLGKVEPRARVRVGSGFHPVYAVALDPRRPNFALVTWDGTLELRSLDGAVVQQFSGLARSLLDVRYSPDGQWLAVAGGDNLVRLYRITEDGLVALSGGTVLEGHQRKVYALAFSPDSKVLASGSTDRTVRLWRAANVTGGLVAMSIGGTEEAIALAFSPDGKQVAVGGSGTAVLIHTLREDDSTAEKLERHEGMQGSPRVPWYAVAEQSGPVIFDAQNTAAYPRSETRPAAMRTLAMSRDGSAVAWPCYRDVPPDTSRADVQIHRVCVGKAPVLGDIVELEYPIKMEPSLIGGNHILSVALAPDASWAVAANRSAEVRLWTLPDGKLKHLLNGHLKAVFSMDASPDGKLLATGSYDKSIRLWDPGAGTELAVLYGSNQGVRQVRFSPDGKTLASTGWDRTVRLWDVATRKQRAVCTGHADHVFGLDWSPDGKWLASTGRDGTLRIWDSEHCEPLATLVADEREVYGLAVWGTGRGLSYAGTSVHRYPFKALNDPAVQLRDLEHATGLRVDGLDLVPLSSGP